MCGLLGYSGSKPIDPIELKIMFLMAEDRGGHACGWGTKDKIHKKAVKSDEFVVKSDFPKGVKEIIGHTRYATNGSKGADKNAHPFVLDTLTGTHNGSLDNFFQLRREEGLTSKVDVDSELLYIMLEKYGLDNALEKFTGNMALAWIDDNGLNLYRKRKPLFFGFKDGNMYYGSKPEYLTAAGCNYTEEVEEDTHYLYSEGVLINERELKTAPKKPTKSYFGQSGYVRTVSPVPAKYFSKEYASRVTPPKDAVIIESATKTIYGWVDVTETKLFIKSMVYSTFKLSTGTLYKFDLTNHEQIGEIDRCYPYLFEAMQIENYKSIYK